MALKSIKLQLHLKIKDKFSDIVMVQSVGDSDQQIEEIGM